MCGILGYIGPRSFDAVAFGRALDVMRNRGPDDRGIYEEPECLLGHRRLAILDLSAAGHQPMASHEGRFVIVFNGEVYNYRELRKPLEEEGVHFRSNTDTEMILELYARRGPECLKDFRGMFALAIWDRDEKSLFLARDRMGIKPLYIWLRPNGIGFASEVRALRAFPDGPRGVEPEALVQFLAWGSVPAPLTITQGVESLKPASWMLWKKGSITKGTYWEFPAGVAPSGCGAERGQANPYLYQTRSQVLEALRPLLREAVAYRCISDAPLGAFLSGGIDSSSVVSLMRHSGQAALHTFSISFPQTPLDEGPFAHQVAKQFQTQHTDVPLNADEAEEGLEDFFGSMDQPSCDGFNTYMVSKFAREGGLTVALSGLGGDELFAGYGHYRKILWVLPWVNRTSRLAAWTAGLAASAAQGRWKKLQALSLCAPWEANGGAGSLPALYYASRGLFMPSQIKMLLHPDLLAQTQLGQGNPASLLPSSSLSNFLSFSPLHSLMALELRRYMHDQLLRDSDVFGMAHSLEIRVPLIDHRVVELLFQAAPRTILLGSPKSLLLEALPSPLPPQCIHRPKMGFTFPFASWIGGSWKKRLEGVLLQQGARFSLLNRAGVQALWQKYLEGKIHWSRVWQCLVLQRLNVA